MEIEIGKFRIESDKNQFILYETRKKGAFRGKQAEDGDTTEDIVGYYSTLEQLFKAFPSRMLQRSNVTSLREVMDELERYRGLINESIKGA